MTHDRALRIGWWLFDFANSAYVLIVIAFAFPLFFRETLAAGASNKDWLWGLSLGASVMLAGTIAPFLTSALDARGRHGDAFRVLTITAISGTTALAFIPPRGLALGMTLFIVTNATFVLSVSLYDSFLGRFADVQKRGTMSAIGWSLGYAGGILCLLTTYPWLRSASSGQVDSFRIVLLITAAWYALFSLPILWIIPRTFETAPRSMSGTKLLQSTLYNWRVNRPLFLFIIAYYFLTDATGTLTNFASVVARETLGFTVDGVAKLLLYVQVVAIPATLMSGRLADRIGARSVVIGGTIGWLVICVWMYWASSTAALYAIATLIGLVIGSTYSAARALLTSLTKPLLMTQAFGLNAFSGRISETIAPILFGWISTSTGSQRAAIVSMCPFLLIALVLFIWLGWLSGSETAEARMQSENTERTAFS